ncbi:hypothetical protein QBZ16_000136 [Prototheca wickerhamii]|uniref:MMS19 nucleotide excision repair protein n=1 Tax=Prototheca wickerhamii TaxID=3111 RepID=A0AAD9MMW0_PROWI|nr:hypothetical protein QBZ16_000136 [Prototheca wickerhamii]
MGCYLTSDNDVHRCNALDILAIARDAIFANGDQQSHAIDFCIARLVDRASLEPALRGCLMFLKAESPSAAPRATPAQLLDLAKNLTENVFPQQLPQATRSQAMHCLASLIERQGQNILDANIDLWEPTLAAIDGERDPRCLLLAFQLAKLVAQLYEAQPADSMKAAQLEARADGVEELFDIVSCYFPISFTPPPDNPHGLTRETLAASLADTLVATPLFLPFLMPLLEEKLASSHKQAKLDALDLLARLPTAFEPGQLSGVGAWDRVWKRLRPEVCVARLATDSAPRELWPEVVDAATHCLRVWAQSVGPWDAELGPSLAEDPVIREMRQCLQSPGSNATAFERSVALVAEGTTILAAVALARRALMWQYWTGFASQARAQLEAAGLLTVLVDRACADVEEAVRSSDAINAPAGARPEEDALIDDDSSGAAALPEWPCDLDAVAVQALAFARQVAVAAGSGRGTASQPGTAQERGGLWRALTAAAVRPRLWRAALQTIEATLSASGADLVSSTVGAVLEQLLPPTEHPWTARALHVATQLGSRTPAAGPRLVEALAARLVAPSTSASETSAVIDAAWSLLRPGPDLGPRSALPLLQSLLLMDGPILPKETERAAISLALAVARALPVKDQEPLCVAAIECVQRAECGCFPVAALAAASLVNKAVLAPQIDAVVAAWVGAHSLQNAPAAAALARALLARGLFQRGEAARALALALEGVALGAEAAAVVGHVIATPESGTLLAQHDADSLPDPLLACGVGIPNAVASGALWQQRALSQVLDRVLADLSTGGAGDKDAALSALAALLGAAPFPLARSHLDRAGPHLAPALCAAIASPSPRVAALAALPLLRALRALAERAGDGDAGALAALTELAPALLPAIETAVGSAPSWRVRVAAVGLLDATVRAVPYPRLHAHAKTVARALALALDDDRRSVRRVAGRCSQHWRTL